MFQMTQCREGTNDNQNEYKDYNDNINDNNSNDFLIDKLPIRYQELLFAPS